MDNRRWFWLVFTIGVSWSIYWCWISVVKQDWPFALWHLWFNGFLCGLAASRHR